MTLTIMGVPPITLRAAPWRDTPGGRVLVLRGRGDELVTLTVTHGRCAHAAGAPATLSIGGRVLAGCLLDDGPRPYPG